MTTETEEQELARRAEWAARLRDAVTDLRHEIEALAEQAKAEGRADEAAARQALGKLKDLVTQCMKAEMLLDESRSKQDGSVRGAHAIDMDRARAEIGCKLDRLRRCGRPRAVPE